MKQQSVNQKDPIKSLRSYHAVIAVLCILAVLAVIFIENWSEVFVWLPIAVAVFLDGKFEKADELAKQYIARANSICMWTLFAVLGIFAMAVKYHAISLSALMIVIFGGLALRSILFLCFDMLPPGSKEDSDA